MFRLLRERFIVLAGMFGGGASLLVWLVETMSREGLRLDLASMELAIGTDGVDYCPSPGTGRGLFDPCLRIEQEVLAVDVDSRLVGMAHPPLYDDAVNRHVALLTFESGDLQPALLIAAFGANDVARLEFVQVPLQHDALHRQLALRVALDFAAETVGRIVRHNIQTRGDNVSTHTRKTADGDFDARDEAIR
ncbi:MAG: hypothetical protein BGP19_00900 [Thiobacillus sp. 0-1251]|nr:MAG: hypothetical protein BGP19_00900 [Thiobacillus sp. 0-1251]